jgi:hypothetical protein
MPGGSGLLDQICERFEEIVAIAMEVVQDCPSACETSCIDCLQTFRNGYYHKYLDRNVAKERLSAWGKTLAFSHEIPAKQPSKGPAEGSYPINEAERRLRQLLIAAGFEEGTRGQQLRLDRAIGTTTPDVIYRASHHAEDEGICIYLDGLSGHSHGRRETAEHDQRIRTWLRNNGYEVIEIAVSDLDDSGAMTRHFRRLAGYLGSNELRDKLRTNTSWFNAEIVPPHMNLPQDHAKTGAELHLSDLARGFPNSPFIVRLGTQANARRIRVSPVSTEDLVGGERVIFAAPSLRLRGEFAAAAIGKLAIESRSDASSGERYVLASVRGEGALRKPGSRRWSGRTLQVLAA